LQLRRFPAQPVELFLAAFQSLSGGGKILLGQIQPLLMLLEFFDLAFRATLQVFQALPIGGLSILQPGLLRERIEVGRLLLLQIVPERLLALFQLVDSALPQGKRFPAGENPVVR